MAGETIASHRNVM